MCPTDSQYRIWLFCWEPNHFDKDIIKTDGRYMYLTLKFPVKDQSSRTIAVGENPSERKIDEIRGRPGSSG